MQLVVLGMHRSGTSGVTRLLNLAGAWFGPEGIATEANDENPKGFWERRDVRAVCDGLLHGGGFDWHRLDGFSLEALPPGVVEQQLAAFGAVLAELDQHRPWVVKEPRLCLLFPLLRPQLDQPVCIHVTREPLEVALSLHARNGLPVQGALALWELYTGHAIDASAGLPRVHVRHEDVITDPVGTLHRLLADLETLGVTGLQAPPDDVVLDFISPSLHRQKRSASRRGHQLNNDQARLARLIDRGELRDLETAPALSDGALDELATLTRLDDLQRALDDAAREHRRLERALTRGDEALEAERRAVARGREAVAHERHRRRAVADTAIEALDRAERDIRAMNRGRTAQLANYLVAVRRTLTPGLSRRDPTPFSRALAGIEKGRRQVRGRAADRPGSTEPRPAPVASDLITRTAPAAPPSDRRKVAVIAWDVGHNPLGRANVLAEVLARHFEVELWGAQFDRYGSRIWAPLRGTPVPVNVFPGRPFPDHLAVMDAVAAEIDADAVWVSKPRLPSLLLGVLAKQARNRPLILDVDDHELAFFATDEGLDVRSLLRRRGDHDLDLPFEREWTRACDPLIGAADLVTVSNESLQERYGGLIVPHARDEALFDPATVDRGAVRRRLGIEPHQRILLFGGTPRIHKGVVEVLEALERLGDPRYRVIVFGTRELDDLRPHIGSLDRWVIPLPYQPFRDLPEVVAAADLACVLQDPTHPVARYQMPAKITDALAMGVPCLVRATPPLQPLIDAGVVRAVPADQPLHEAIEDAFADHGGIRRQVERGRDLFLTTMSYRAVAEALAPTIDALIDQPPPPSPELARLDDVVRDLYAGSTGTDPGTPPPPTPPARVPARDARPIAPGSRFDLVVFWKQNDTGIYGRRQDQLVDHLARSGRVGTIVHFDNPITPEVLARTWRSADDPSHQGRLVVRQTLGRVGPRLADRRHPGPVHHHTFVYGGSRTRRLGLPGRNRYVDFVQTTLRRHGVGRAGSRRPMVVLAYPTNPDLPALIDALAPDLVVADVVDDNRTWFAPGTPAHDRAELNYEQVLARSDLVLANCEPVAESMRAFTPVVHVVPNGLELPDGRPRGPRPPELARLSGPVVGYVGNLSARIDLDLIEGLARARPGWQFVFIGSAHLDDSILRLRTLPNVHFLGVRPHREARRYIEHFDVALIPHLDNEMTRAMNPLKAFVYCAAGVPVVSTPISNVDHLDDLITIAHGVEGFLEAIEHHLEAGRPPADAARLRPHSWDARVATVLDLIDALGSPDDTDADTTPPPIDPPDRV
jgi:glycosyltransferase involved in cell wall biosynthesis